MTVQHRNTARRMRRQNDGPLSGLGPGGVAEGGNNNGGGGSSSANNNPSSSAANPGTGSSSPNNQAPSFTPPDSPPTSPTPNNPNSTPAPNRPLETSRGSVSSTDNASSTSSTDTSSATGLSTASSSSSSSSSASATTSSSSTSTVVLTAPAQVVTSPIGGVPFHSSLAIGTPSTTPSATTSAAPSSGVKVGTVIGGIVGTLVGLAVIGMVASFILRRMRKRNHRDTIIGDEFRNSQFMTGAPTGDSGIRNVNDSDIFEPPNMTEHHRSFAPSIASGPGMAGHGAFHADFGATNAGGYNATGYGTTGYGTTGISAGAMQERPRHTYGQQNDDEVDDVAHGVYSSQPQPQAPYNPEAYGSYAAYGGHATGYQEATREYQGQQHGGYDQHQNGPFGAHAGYGVAVADPGPSTSSGAAGAHPSASRNPATLTGNRDENTRSVAVQDDDVYGGI